MSIEWTRIRCMAKDLLTFGLVLFSIGFLASETVLGIVNRWFKFDQAYSHGLLLLAVSVFLIVRSAKRQPVSLGFYPGWLVPFVLVLVVYALGDIMRVQALSELTIVPMILGAAAVLLGWRQVRQFIVPIGILFLAVPVWDYLAWTLQIITVEVNRLLLGIFGIDFRVEGIFVYLTGIGIFEVAHGCSGLRYLLVGQLLALLYGELNLKSVSSKVWLYLFAVCLALVANWIRVFVIIYVGHESNMQSSLINEHDNFGWMVFAVTLIPLFFAGRVLEKREGNLPGSPAGEEKSLRAPFARDAHSKSVIAACTLIFLSLLAWFALPGVPDSHNVGTSKHASSFVPQDNWMPLFTGNMSGWSPSIERPDRFVERSYISKVSLGTDGETSERLFLGLYSYDVQRAGHELVNYNNRLYEPSRYSVKSVFEVNSENGPLMSGMTLKPLGAENLIHLAYGYYVEGRWENNELQAKLAQLPGIMNKRTDASLLVVALECADCEPQQRLSEVIPQIRSEVENYLDRVYASVSR